MKKFLILAASAALAATAAAADLTFAGESARPVAVTPEKSTGLDRIYVLRESKGVFASYTASGSGDVHWYRFGATGGAYAEEVAAEKAGNTTFVTLSADDCGYIVEEGTTRYYFWIVDYANHRLDLRGLSADPESECATALLRPAGSAEPIIYSTITGVPRELSRDLVVTYNSLTFDENSQSFRQTEMTKTVGALQSTVTVTAPLCDTRFTLTGDRFLREWGEEVTVESDLYQAIAVDGHTSAEQVQREIDNESTETVAGLGGSAPVDVTFTAVVSDAVRFTEWQFSSDPEFRAYDLTFNSTEIDYTFRETGTTYVRFQASNNYGTCDWFSETYEVTIGESKLLCPNAFSPNGDGVNDEWKVSYKSIVEFDCTIFSRSGLRMAHLTDPSQGWDGKYAGKTVPSGAYYYVIKALGSDGHKYNLSGDINIINYSRKPGATSGTVD